MVEKYVALTVEFTKLCCEQRLKKSGVIQFFLLYQLLPNHFYAKEIQTH